jgi:hypothetical protein
VETTRAFDIKRMTKANLKPRGGHTFPTPAPTVKGPSF